MLTKPPPRTGSAPEVSQASSYLQGPPRLVGETRDPWSNVVNAARKMRASGGKTNPDWTRERFLEEVTFEKYKHTRQGRGSKLLVEKPAGGKA